MFTFEFSVNILFLIGLSVFSGFIGFKIKKGVGHKKLAKIGQLEKEMIHNHAEILELQKEYCELEQKLRDLAKPVIPMKKAGKDEGQEDENQREGSSLMKKLPTRSA